ncbi:MAG: hypothetical protein NVSMB57_09410 [Actinomycetota bacterium]
MASSFRLRDDRAAVLFAMLPNTAAREELFHLYHPLAEHLARRFSNGSRSDDDLGQVSSIGLLNAIDRYDAARGVQFPTFAIPTIIGEMKRHFRDSGWALRVPRRVQEHTLVVRSTIADLSQKLHRSPTVPEIAEASFMTSEEVLEALEASNAHWVESLDAPPSEGHRDVTATLTVEDGSLEMAEHWAGLAPLLHNLEDRQRQILHFRFIVDLPQGEIANKLGLSQMHVSRILRRTLTQLRLGLGEPERSERPVPERMLS